MRRFKIPFGVGVFLVVWLIVALIPPLRESFRVWNANRSLVLTNFGTSPDEITQLKASHPDDARVLGQEATLYAFGNAAQRRDAVPRIDALIARFSDQQWLRALRLMVTVSGGIPVEIEEPRSFARSSSKWLDRPQLEMALQVARQAEKREPDNSFWPWMGAAFSFSLHRSSEAIDALARAAKCSHWNDYRLEDARHRLETRSLEGASTWEEKVALQFTELYPHLGVIRDVVRLTVREGRTAMRRGDHNRALQIFGAAMDASQVIQKSTDSFIGVLVGQAMERSVWDGVAEENGAVSPRALRRANSYEEREQTKAKTVDAFAVYARKYGRGDLAARAIADAEYPWSKGMSDYLGRGLAESFGVSQSAFRVAIQGAWLGGLLFGVALVCAAVWLLSTFLNRNADETKSPTRGQIAGCANFTLWSSLIFFAVMLYLGAAGAMQEFIASLSASDESSQNPFTPVRVELTDNIIWILLGLWLFIVVGVTWRQWRKLSSKPVRQPVPFLPSNPGDRYWIAKFVLWGLSIALFILLGSEITGSHHLYRGTPLQWPLSLFWFALSQGGALSSEWKFSRRGGKPKSSFLTALFLAAGLMGTLAFLWLDELNKTASYHQILPLLGALSWASFGAAFVVWANSKIRQIFNSPQRDAWLFAPRLAGATAGVLAVIYSVLYLVTAIAIWSPRAQMNRTLEHRMQMGEVAWMREQIAANPNSEYR